MVNPEEQLQVVPKPVRIRKRTLLCWIILCMALTYFLILAFLFLAGTIYSERIIRIISPYYQTGEDIQSAFHGFSLTGAVLYFISSAGIILFILKKKAGFYIFFASTLIILSLDFAFLTFDWMRYLILSGFIFILGIAHFSKRCYF
jgi:hypothetical protein